MATRKSKKTRKVETTYAKGGAVAKRASKIYESWKREYADDFKHAHGNPKKIKEAAKSYRQKHGATARKRGGNAMKAARKNTAAKQTVMMF